jgi:hypothetical protein
MANFTEVGGTNGTAQAAQQTPGPVDNAGDHAHLAQDASASAQAAANSAEDHARRAERASSSAQAAAHASLGDEPSWVYGMVIVILGTALLALVAGILIASLSGTRTISTDVVSAATLILGGLIGVLAPTPGTKRSPRP